VSYNAALTAHANALPPRPAEARALLDSMAASGVMPERISYNALISALGRAGQWEEAVGMLRSMERGELQVWRMGGGGMG
jgi:pentatricopeptide repeat protein